MTMEECKRYIEYRCEITDFFKRGDYMNILLILAYLFFIGSVIGWLLELAFRNFKNKGKKLINPGFCTGPYLPIYGTGLCVLYLLASLENYYLISDPFWNKAVLFIAMATGMTLIEFIAGVFLLKYIKVRLWDYSNRKGNIQGIICPLFSAIWAALGALYYFLIHPCILEGLEWLSQNLAFSFFIGMFFGVFIIDSAHSAQLVTKLKKFADDNDVIVKYETLKVHLRDSREHHKYHFFRPFHSERPLQEMLKEMQENLEKRLHHQ